MPISARWRRRNPSGLAAITDAFNRADNASSLGNTDTGQTWTVFGGAVMGISSNQAYMPTVSALAGAVVDRGSPNMTVQATMAVWAGSNIGLIFRWVDANNYWLVGRSGGQILINSITAGATTNRATYTPGAIADGDVLLVSVDGNNLITAKQNGATLGTLTNATNATGTQGGLGGVAVTGSRWDTFSMTSP